MARLFVHCQALRILLISRRSLGHAESVGDGWHCHNRHRACQAACAAGGWAFVAEQRLRHVYRQAGPYAGCAHRGAGWAWRDMQLDVSCCWCLGRPGIGY